jgi:hypothetical protein
VAQVFAALRSDFSTRRRERCVRVDFAAGLVTGVDDLERLLRDALKATFEARATAYDEEVPVLAARHVATMSCMTASHMFGHGILVVGPPSASYTSS